MQSTIAAATCIQPPAILAGHSTTHQRGHSSTGLPPVSNGWTEEMNCGRPILKDREVSYNHKGAHLLQREVVNP